MHKSISWAPLFYILISIIGCTEPTAEHKIEKLIKKLGVKDPSIRRRVANELGSIGSVDAVPALIQLLHQGQDLGICSAIAKTLKRIGTPKALKAVKEYASQQ